ncbi:MAG: rhodanese-like domain-containing protein [Bacteroidetes bacterium]|jgi:rhodanese-related sulfurtransferase|nr:rhodanese-like domain-containing protein [Bacteroidota bacterium]MDF1865169.1 rhodanese-like domain-containing protein [Saprospiraceae bacterium]
MKWFFIILIVGFILFTVKSFAQNSGAFENIDVAQFKEKMTESNIVILDVRTPKETAQGKIEGTLEINFFDPKFASKVKNLDKSKTYLVYCRSGNRSAKACNIMAKNGFENLYNLKGGYNAWN